MATANKSLSYDVLFIGDDEEIRGATLLTQEGDKCLLRMFDSYLLVNCGLVFSPKDIDKARLKALQIKEGKNRIKKLLNLNTQKKWTQN